MAASAYEAMWLLAKALEKTGGKSEGLTRVLPGTRINGLMEPVSLDQFGDGVRNRYRFIVEDGKFLTAGRVHP